MNSANAGTVMQYGYRCGRVMRGLPLETGWGNLNSGAIGFGKKEQGDGFDGNQSISASLVSSIHRN